MSDPIAQAPPPPADSAGLFEDFIDIFVTPAKVFARRAKSGGGMAFLVVCIALAAVLYSGKNVMEPIMDAQIAKGMAAAQKANPNLTNEQLQAGIAFQKKLAPVFMVIGAPLAVLGVALLVWVVGKVFGAAVTFGMSVMIASYAYVPRVLAGIVTDVHGLLMDDTSRLTNPSQLSMGPARFFDPDATGAVTLAMLTRLDLVTIWVTVLLAVGLYAAGKLSKEKAITAGVVIWVLGCIFPLWGAIRQG